VKVLLDTHTFIWFIAGSPRLSAPVRAAIESAENDRFLSAASIFEMAIKISLGKLRIEEPLDQLLAREIDSNAFSLLSIEVRHVAMLASLPFHHRDPFDRLLAAQAYTDDMLLLSTDEAFDAYGIRRLW
jgi:PIN domain nuclease of toxin-antitoxin system